MAFGAGRFICSAHGILRLLQKLSATCFLCFRGNDQPSQTVFEIPFSNFQPCWGLPERVFGDSLLGFCCCPKKCCWLGEIFRLPISYQVSWQYGATKSWQPGNVSNGNCNCLADQLEKLIHLIPGWSTKMPVFFWKNTVETPKGMVT